MVFNLAVALFFHGDTMHLGGYQLPSLEYNWNEMANDCESTSKSKPCNSGKNSSAVSQRAYDIVFQKQQRLKRKNYETTD